MLDLMRKHSKSWIIKFLLIVIIIVFVLYFGATTGRNKADTLVTIDKKAVTYVAFQKEYQDLVEMYRKRFGGHLTEDMLKAMKVKEQVLDKMIYEAILLKKAQELHVTVSDEELKNIIAATPAFQRNGAFDEKQYQQMLRYNRIKPEDFEATQKKNMIVSKLEDLLQDGVSVSDAEVYDFYRITNEKINVSWVRIPVKDFQQTIHPTTADLEKYYKDHSNELKMPDQIRIKYIAFTAQAYSAEVKVSDDEVQEAYNRYKGQQGKAEAAPPLASVREKIIQDLKQSKGLRHAYDAAKKAHDVIYQQNNFDAYTAQNRLSIETTDFFAAKNPPPTFKQVGDFEKIAFGLQKDEISSVLSSNNGYYLVKLLERKAAYTPALKDVEADIRQKFIENEAKRLARQEADGILGKMKSGESLKNAIGNRKLPVTETGFFLPTIPPAQLGTSPELRRSLFLLSSKKPYADQAFPVDGAFVLLEFKERAKVDDGEFAKQKNTLKDTLLRIRKTEAIQSWMEATKNAMIKEGRIKFNKEPKDL
jgi:peptidyl-prolyl cis-trans isomerase D